MCICTAFGGVIMNKICTFAGHGKIDYGEKTYKKMISYIKQLICEEKIYNFWVGNYGSFDKLVAKAVNSLKTEYPNIKLCLVVPYITYAMSGSQAYYKDTFDEILVPEFPPHKSIRSYIPLCNEYMIDNACVLICYVENDSGGAAQTYGYALKNKTRIINLAD